MMWHLMGTQWGKKKPLSSTTSGMICSANTVCNSIEIKVVYFRAETKITLKLLLYELQANKVVKL